MIKIFKTNNKATHVATSVMLSVALAMTSVNIGTIDNIKTVSAAIITNPIDTGNDYEYSTGQAIGYQRIKDASTRKDTSLYPT